LYTIQQPANPSVKEILIYDIQLKLVKMQVLNGTTDQLNLAEMADGAYYMIYNEYGKRTVKLIEKMSRISK
jgi:hypothetical protein